MFYDSLYQFFLVSHACQRLVTLILFIQRQLVEESHKCKFSVVGIGLGSRWLRSGFGSRWYWSILNDYWSRRNDYWIGHIDWNVRHWDKQICRWSIRRIVSLACHKNMKGKYPHLKIKDGSCEIVLLHRVLENLANTHLHPL